MSKRVKVVVNFSELANGTPFVPLSAFEPGSNNAGRHFAKVEETPALDPCVCFNPERCKRACRPNAIADHNLLVWFCPDEQVQVTTIE